MARCWTCGAYTKYPVYRCSTCRIVKEIENLQKKMPTNFNELAEVQRHGFEMLSDRLSEISAIIEWSFAELSWQLHQQTKVLQSINHTLKTPSQTQADEWRQIAEGLRNRGVLDESEKFFLKSLETNPLDYRAYTGLAETYLQKDEFDEAEIFLKRSLPHAPERKGIELSAKDEVFRCLNNGQEYSAACTYFDATEEEWEEAYNFVQNIKENLKDYEPFDYKSYSFRLIGHIYACKENYTKATKILQSALQLSPYYWDAYYDYAQYCAQMGDEENCLSGLQQTIIDGGPLYFYLAQKEKNFELFGKEVQDLLEGIRIVAFRKAKNVISELENKLRQVDEAITWIQRTPSWAREVLKEKNFTDYYKEAKSELVQAKNKASKNYAGLLEAYDLARSGNSWASSIKAAKKGELAYRRWRSEIGSVAFAGLGATLFLAIVLGLPVGAGIWGGWSGAFKGFKISIVIGLVLVFVSTAISLNKWSKAYKRYKKNKS